MAGLAVAIPVYGPETNWLKTPSITIMMQPIGALAPHVPLYDSSEVRPSILVEFFNNKGRIREHGTRWSRRQWLDFRPYFLSSL